MINKIKNFFLGTKKRKIFSGLLLIGLVGLTLVLFGINLYIGNPEITHFQGELKNTGNEETNSFFVVLEYENKLIQSQDGDVRAFYVITEDNRVFQQSTWPNIIKIGNGQYRTSGLEFRLLGGTMPAKVLLQFKNGREDIAKDINPEDLLVGDIYDSLPYLSSNVLSEFKRTEPTITLTPTVSPNPNLLNNAIESVNNQWIGFIQNPQINTKVVPLDKANISMVLPKSSAAVYLETQPKSESDDGPIQYYDTAKDCYKTDPNTSKPTTEEIYCKYYLVDFSIYSSDFVIFDNRQIKIYVDSYPINQLNSLVGVNTQIYDKPINLFGKEYVIHELNRGATLDILYITFKTSSGKVVTIVEEDNVNSLLKTKYPEFFFKTTEAIISNIR